MEFFHRYMNKKFENIYNNVICGGKHLEEET